MVAVVRTVAICRLAVGTQPARQGLSCGLLGRGNGDPVVGVLVQPHKVVVTVGVGDGGSHGEAVKTARLKCAVAVVDKQLDRDCLYGKLTSVEQAVVLVGVVVHARASAAVVVPDKVTQAQARVETKVHGEVGVCVGAASPPKVVIACREVAQGLGGRFGLTRAQSQHC